jgi:Na+-transporting NADH:ubiquinone oxidoreductase subunit NqrD
MSALAALTASVPPCEAAMAGIRWGLGHSAGLLVVTAIFLGVGEKNMNLEKIG